jgi:YgiT-type zinc finger domain-containing protein
VTIRDQVHEAARRRLLFLPHAIRQMVRAEPMIATTAVRATVLQGDVIEDYPEDVRGHSCLMPGPGDGRSLHVVCSPRSDYLAIHHCVRTRSGSLVDGPAYEETEMTCVHCGGELESGTAPFSIDRKGYHVSWDDVPAWVYTQCGEPLFEEAAVAQIQRGLTAMERETKALRRTG